MPSDKKDAVRCRLTGSTHMAPVLCHRTSKLGRGAPDHLHSGKAGAGGLHQRALSMMLWGHALPNRQCLQHLSQLLTWVKCPIALLKPELLKSQSLYSPYLKAGQDRWGRVHCSHWQHGIALMTLERSPSSHGRARGLMHCSAIPSLPDSLTTPTAHLPSSHTQLPGSPQWCCD
jgi:hypothetical protein